MGYRQIKKEKPRPNRTAVDIVTPSRFVLHNGGTGHFAHPCWYEEIKMPKRTKHHNRLIHDKVGWPTPERPDRSCQASDFAYDFHRNPPGIPGFGYWGHGVHGPNKEYRNCRELLDMTKVFPIHLLREGYDKIEIEMIDPPVGLQAAVSFDTEKDWIIRIEFDARIPWETFEGKPIVVKFSVYVSRPQEDSVFEHRDLACVSELVILPATGFEE